MDLKLARLRSGEILVGLAGVVLLVLMVAVHWYGRKTGFETLTSARWLLVVAIATALALTFFQATRPAPGLPVALSVIVFVLGLLSALWLIYRVAISPAAGERAGAWLGLAAGCLIPIGAFLSMRQEGILPADEPHDIPVVLLRGGDH